MKNLRPERAGWRYYVFTLVVIVFIASWIACPAKGQTIVNEPPTDADAIDALAHTAYLASAPDSIYTLRLGGTIRIPLVEKQVFEVKFISTRNDPSRVTLAGKPAEVVRRATLRTAYNDTARYGWLPRPPVNIIADTAEYFYSQHMANLGVYSTLFSPATFQRYSITVRAWWLSVSGSGSSTTIRIRIVKERFPWYK